MLDGAIASAGATAPSACERGRVASHAVGLRRAQNKGSGPTPSSRARAAANLARSPSV